MHSGVLSIIIVAVVVAVILAILVVLVLLKRRPKGLEVAVFTKRWKEVEKLCRSATTWPLAVLDADKLLDDALKKSRCKGKTMGERLVSAQRRISDNDSTWFGHKLRNRIAHEDMGQLKKKDVQTALRGFRQALKDLGALK
jgi:hypothetical protein